VKNHFRYYQSQENIDIGDGFLMENFII